MARKRNDDTTADEVTYLDGEPQTSADAALSLTDAPVPEEPPRGSEAVTIVWRGEAQAPVSVSLTTATGPVVLDLPDEATQRAGFSCPWGNVVLRDTIGYKRLLGGRVEGEEGEVRDGV